MKCLIKPKVDQVLPGFQLFQKNHDLRIHSTMSYLLAMPSLEEVCINLLGRPGWAPKVLVGGALSFIPLLNFIPLGYLLEYTIRLRHKGVWDLPDWQNVPPLILFKSGFRFFVLLLAYAGCPIMIGCLITTLLDGITFGI
jgi:hypothetical protein